MAKKFNQQQLLAINKQDADILVSAAAGSGKTTILVERVVQKILQGYCDVDKMLILTFTEAAAAEMKQRIDESLSQSIAYWQNEGDESKQKALLLQKEKLSDAYISTFHAFCSRILKQYSYLVDIDPDFDMLEEGQARILQTEVLNNLLVSKWVNEAEFLDINRLYFNDIDYAGLKEMILRLYYITTGYSDTSAWLNHIISFLQERSNYQKSTVYQFIKDDCLSYIDKITLQIEKLKEYSDINNFDKYITDLYPEELVVVKTLKDYISKTDHDYNTMVSQISSIVTGNQKGSNMKYPEGTDEAVKKEFSKRRAKIKDDLKSILSTFYCYDEQTQLKHLEHNYNFIVMLGKYVLDFKESFSQSKKTNNYLDFNDLEQLSMKILTDRSNGVATFYNELFHEIMIDEYQDTNGVQEYLIELIVSSGKKINRFMVGDMKQSIYRFRQADPLLFKNKYDAFQNLDNNLVQESVKVNLGYNYRSKVQVLDSINYIFNQIMDTQLGELEYYNDASAKLNFDQNVFKILDNNDNMFTTEVIVLDEDAGVDGFEETKESPEKSAKEANIVANRILELIGKPLYDNSGNYIKDTELKDIVVLSRNGSNLYHFKKVFDERNIPCVINLKNGFMNANEIVSLIALIKFLSNINDDINALAVLRAPFRFSDFTENELAKIVGKKPKDKTVYQLIEESSHEKAVIFVKAINGMQEYSLTHDIYELVKNIYKETNLREYVLNQNNALQKQANLDLFLEDILGYAKSGFDLIFLSKYFRQLEEIGYDKKGAQIASKEDNVVNFMTIHSSKGLQFPIVFLIETHVSFNVQDSRNVEQVDSQYGIGVSYSGLVNVEGFNPVVKRDTSVYKEFIKRKNHDKLLSEEMRLLYVALTRAESKIIITGLGKRDTIDSWIIDARNQSDIILPYHVRTSRNYMQWIIYGIARHSKVGGYAGLCDIEGTSDFKLDILNSFESDKVYNTPSHSLTMPDVSRYTAYTPIYDQTPYRQSVTQLKQLSSSPHVTYYDIEEEPSEVAGNVRGTLIHKFMEYLPTTKQLDISLVLQDLTTKGLFTSEESEVIRKALPYIERFKDSDCFNVMLSANKIYKELPFVTKSSSGTLIHGIMDAVCEVEDKIIVIDYKSDRVRENDDLYERYRVQMEYYMNALKELYPHKEIYAYVYFIQIAKTYIYKV